MSVTRKDITDTFGKLDLKGPRLPAPAAELMGASLTSSFPEVTLPAAKTITQHLHKISHAKPDLGYADALSMVGQDLCLKQRPYHSAHPSIEKAVNENHPIASVHNEAKRVTSHLPKTKAEKVQVAAKHAADYAHGGIEMDMRDARHRGGPTKQEVKEVAHDLAVMAEGGGFFDSLKKHATALHGHASQLAASPGAAAALNSPMGKMAADFAISRMMGGGMTPDECCHEMQGAGMFSDFGKRVSSAASHPMAAPMLGLASGYAMNRLSGGGEFGGSPHSFGGSAHSFGGSPHGEFGGSPHGEFGGSEWMDMIHRAEARHQHGGYTPARPFAGGNDSKYAKDDRRRAKAHSKQAKTERKEARADVKKGSLYDVMRS